MNQILTIETDYIHKADRSVDIVMLTNESNFQKLVYVYNHEGVHFRLFDDLIELSNFLSGHSSNVLMESESEEHIDQFLEVYRL